MNTSKWLIICFVVVAALAIGELIVIFGLRGDIEGAEKKIATLTEQFEDISSEDGSGGPDERDDRIRALELKLHGMRQKVENIDPDGEGAADLGAAIDGVLGEGDGQQPARQNLKDRFRKRTSIDTIAERLELSPDQKNQFVEASGRARNALVEVATLAKTEDQEFLDELKGLVRERMPLRKKVMTLRKKLTETSVPGTETSYFGRMMEVRGEVVGDLKEILTEEQFKKFRGMRINPLFVHAEGEEDRGGLFGFGLVDQK